MPLETGRGQGGTSSPSHPLPGMIQLGIERLFSFRSFCWELASQREVVSECTIALSFYFWIKVIDASKHPFFLFQDIAFSITFRNVQDGAP